MYFGVLKRVKIFKEWPTVGYVIAFLLWSAFIILAWWKWHIWHWVWHHVFGFPFGLWAVVSLILATFAFLHFWFKRHEVSFFRWWTTAIGWRAPDQRTFEKINKKDHLGDALIEFARDEERRSLLVSGDWGVGKTHRVREFLSHHPIRRCVGFSYVSLFGLTSIDQVREEILAEIDVEDRQPALFLCGLFRFLLPIVTLVVRLTRFGSVLDFLVRRFVRRIVIVVDDLERRDASLALRTVLGFIDKLTVEAGCRSILICNENRLSDGDKLEIQEYRDKTVDTALRYNPTVDDCVAIAFPKGCDGKLERVFEAFPTRNIRILRLARSAVHRLDPFSEGMLPEVRETFRTHAAALAVAYYTFPKIDFGMLKSFLPLDVFGKKKALIELPGGEELLRAEYSFRSYDPFIIDYLKFGVVDENEIKRNLKIDNGKERERLIYAKVNAAWEMAVDSFDHTAEEVKRAFEDIYATYGDEMNIDQIRRTAEGLQEVGESPPAEDWYETWFQRFTQGKTAKDIQNFLYSEPGHLPGNMHARLREFMVRHQAESPVNEIFDSLCKPTALLQDHEIMALSDIPKEELMRWILAPSEFRKRSNIRTVRTKLQMDDRAKEIAAKFDEALDEIGQRSPFDKRRVETWMKTPIQGGL